MKRVHVAAAVIRGVDGRVLIARRPDDKHQGGLWEFPGGKVEEGEPVQAALARELEEELGIRVAITPNAVLRATMMAVHDLATRLREEGPMAEDASFKEFAKHPIGDFHTFAGFDKVRAWEADYMPAEEQAKYEGTVGHTPSQRKAS